MKNSAEIYELEVKTFIKSITKLTYEIEAKFNSFIIKGFLLAECSIEINFIIRQKIYSCLQLLLDTGKNLGIKGLPYSLALLNNCLYSNDYKTIEWLCESHKRVCLHNLQQQTLAYKLLPTLCDLACKTPKSLYTDSFILPELMLLPVSHFSTKGIRFCFNN